MARISTRYYSECWQVPPLGHLDQAAMRCAYIRFSPVSLLKSYTKQVHVQVDQLQSASLVVLRELNRAQSAGGPGELVDAPNPAELDFDHVAVERNVVSGCGCFTKPEV